MLGFVVRQLRHRTGRAATLGAGILVAAASFVLLTSAAQTSELQVKGTVVKNFRAAYDILVRPESSFTRFERTSGLVRANYLAGLYGGITFHQYRSIRRLPGVEVAAPIANIGYIMPFQFVPFPINRFLSKDSVQMYRLRVRWSGQHGLSSYPDSDQYVYFTRQHPFVVNNDVGDPREVIASSPPAQICRGFSFRREPDETQPFSLVEQSALHCFSAKSPGVTPSGTDYRDFPKGYVGALGMASFPIPLAAIDPVAENKLLNLDSTVVSGRPLRESDRPRIVHVSKQFDHKVVPFLASTRTYVDERIQVDVQRLRIPAPSGLRRQLASKRGANRFVTSLTGTTVGHMSLPIAPIYQRLLEEGENQSGLSSYVTYWTSGPVRYQRLTSRKLAPVAVHNPKTVFQSAYYGGGWAPHELLDTQFRRLAALQGSTHFFGKVYGTPSLKIVGRFDPRRLPGFSSLSQVPLETYYPPTVEPGNQATRRLLDDKPLLPTQNIAGYVAQPPLMLTTLKGLRAMVYQQSFPGANAAAPISVIRIRVAGVTGADPLSRERIKGVAAAIHRKTGLAVDITAGSSPHPMLIDLPKGKFGQPPLTVREGWVEKGVAVRFLDAVDKKSLFLFSLILVVCGLFLANAALASVRARRTEIGTLLTLGWSRASIFRAIVAELALVGALAGIAGTVLALIAVPLLSLHISLLRTLLVAPVAVVVAIIAGLLPAWRAARGRPLDALSPPVTGGDHRRHVSHILGMALANTVRIPARTLIAITGLVFGVAALTVLIALNRALQGTLVGTLMGHFISSQIRGVDFLSVLLVIALGGLSVADILFLNLSERSAELVTLRTVGWRDQHLRALIGLEGIATGALGCLIGAAFGIGVAALIRGVPITTIALAATVAAGAGLVVTVLAALLPLIRITALTPPTVLAEE
jgi:ABC-type antimicrobial peptide transport system permease subunit